MYSEILKTNVRKILGQKILRQCVVKFFLTFGNNLRKEDSKILRKFASIPNF